MLNEENKLKKKQEIMVKSFDCYAKHGLAGTGINLLAKSCNMSKGNIYIYFDNLDQLIIESTAYVMEKVEDDFMALAPTSLEDVNRFLDEVPYWTKNKHGEKYRLMYQVYTHPKYYLEGKKFFEGVSKRYQEYAKKLEGVIGISSDILTPLIFIFVRASVHYALFEDEYYLKSQIKVLKLAVSAFLK